jgi:hypothetical protein
VYSEPNRSEQGGEHEFWLPSFYNHKTKQSPESMYLLNTLVGIMRQAGFRRAGKSLIQVSDVVTALALELVETRNQLGLAICSRMLT